MKKKLIIKGKKIIVMTMSGVAIMTTSCNKTKEDNIDTNLIDSNLSSTSDSFNYNQDSRAGTVATIKIDDNSEYILREDGNSNNDSSINDDSKTDEYNSNVATTNIDANDVLVSFKNIDTKDSLKNIKNIKTNYYFLDLIKPEKSLDKYKMIKEYNSDHSLKYFNNKKVDSNALRTKIIENNKKYFASEHKSFYKECSSNEFNTIFNNLIFTLENNVTDDVDIFQLDDVLDDLKIVTMTGTSNGAFVTYENIMAINFDLLNKINIPEAVDLVCIHESNHIIQSGSTKEKENEGYEKNMGILYQWSDLNVNALNYQWFVEGSAEKLIEKNKENSNETYKYMLQSLNSIYLSSIFNRDINEYSLANISLQPDLNKLFNYFGCEDESDKIDIIMLLYNYEIINNSSNEEFKNAYKEKYNQIFSLNYNDLLKCKCAEILTKNFYRNLINGLSTNEESLGNIIYMIKLFEKDLNNNAKTTYIRNDDQKEFLEKYLIIREEFFDLVSKSTSISKDEINCLYNNYNIDSNNINVSKYFNEEQKQFIIKMAENVNLNEIYLLDNYKIKVK